VLSNKSPISVHTRACPLREWVGKNLDKHWDDYYKFGCVRNPWARTVSWYEYCKTDKNIDRNTSRVTFNDFILHMENVWAMFTHPIHNKPNGKYPRQKKRKLCNEGSWSGNQIDYFTDGNGNIIVNDIFVCNSIMSKNIEKRIKPLDIKLEHRNKTNHSIYTQYYNDKLIDIVGDKYSRDIDTFNFKYGEDLTT
tara:strand:- start:4883 stop:5464 length:582 start_codon:yes stop_codon:yes gene_type:complete